MEIKCYNKKCGHKFDYNGAKTDDKDTITCPKCRYKLRLGKAKISNEVGLPHEVTSPTSLLTSQYHKEIKQPETEIIDKSHFEVPKKEKATSSLKSSSGLFCEKHGLPGKYDSDLKKRICEKCVEEEINSNIKIPFKERTDNLARVRSLQPNFKITQLN